MKEYNCNFRWTAEEWFRLHQILYEIKNNLINYNLAKEDDFKEYEKIIKQPMVTYPIYMHRKGIYLLEAGFKNIMFGQKNIAGVI